MRSFLIAAIALSCAAPAPWSAWVGKDQIARLVESRGYTVKAVTVEASVYEAEVKTREGETPDLNVEPPSGEILV